jgi:hypothetical protein
MMHAEPKILGTQNPELKNSPVAWEGDEETETLREIVPSEPGCFFNDHEFAHGTVVIGNGVRLRCDHGLWVPAGAPERT